MISDLENTVSQTSASVLQENTIAVISRFESERTENEDSGKEILSDEQVDGKSRSQEKTTPKLSDSSEKKLTESLVKTEQEESAAELGEDAVQPKGESEEYVKEVFDSEVEEEAGPRDATLLGSRITGLEISRQFSPGDLQEQILEVLKNENLVSITGGAPYEPPTRPNPFEDWNNEVWLKIAARQRASRRSRKKDDIALRKEKYPELYRSDVSINPSYTDVQLPYYAVARQRYLRALRLIQKQIRGDIEEMALLQPRALDGVRIIRTFCQGAAPDEKRHILNPKDRRRLEYLLAGNVY